MNVEVGLRRHGIQSGQQTQGSDQVHDQDVGLFADLSQ